MPDKKQTQYEAQLPKLKQFNFERFFNILAGCVSIFGVLGASFVIENKRWSDNLIIFVLTIIIFSLLFYTVLQSKKRLYRYEQSVFYVHFAQHIVRDALARLKLGNAVTEDTTEKLLTSISECFSIISGKKCRVCIVEIKENSHEIEVVARDSMSSIDATKRKNVHLLKDNTDFENLWYSINGSSRYYLNNNIKKSWIDHEYKNSSFSEHGEPKVRSLFGYKYVSNWSLNYNSALVLPIRYAPTTEMLENVRNPSSDRDYHGFLCIDSKSTKVFDDLYSPELGAFFADLMYTYFKQSIFIVSKIDKINN